MPFDAIMGNHGEGAHQQPGKTSEALILCVFVRHLIASFQFDSDGKVIAIGFAPEFRSPGVPGAPMKGDILNDFATSTHE